MDPDSSLPFDSHYFGNLELNRGLLQSDAALLTNFVSKANVDNLGNQTEFFENFKLSMQRMGEIDLLTTSAGEIRRKCAFVNWHDDLKPLGNVGICANKTIMPENLWAPANKFYLTDAELPCLEILLEKNVYFLERRCRNLFGISMGAWFIRKHFQIRHDHIFLKPLFEVLFVISTRHRF